MYYCDDDERSFSDRRAKREGDGPTAKTAKNRLPPTHVDPPSPSPSRILRAAADDDECLSRARDAFEVIIIIMIITILLLLLL